MKKIGIITLLYKNFNYGGLLQAYATKKILQNIKILAEHIAIDEVYVKKTTKEKLKEKRIKGIVRSLLSRLKKLLNKLTLQEKNRLKNQIKIERNINVRREKFSDFMETTGYEGPYDSLSIKGSLKKYSIFLTGSDQVWNPEWHKGAYYLDFVPDDIPKISYAASIGKNQLTKEQLDYAIPKIKRLDYISVREKEAKDLLTPYIDKEIKVVLDPTLLLTQKDWNAVAVTPTIEDAYIFVYLLGNNKEHRTKIKQIAEILNLKIVFLPHIHFQYELADENFADIDLYDVGPAEFVGLIKNAQIVITDSFHGCIFSIIFHKKFWALKRHKDKEKENMNARLYTLFRSLGLEERLLDDDQKLTRKELLDEIAYEAVDEKLEILRKDSMDFLKNALSESAKAIKKNEKKE
ncbi:polysaccharide pyruvyl transferase family protein [Eubacterium limosum]|uniref:polysaccharide pyruvyl transferase family protein n=1 Tax=Eubacterium limosum TaxID=1736 RepID=UPI0010628A37|nr:polysaccharide pyruvyl transferase family protein [Eubacterium limosum]